MRHNRKELFYVMANKKKQTSLHDILTSMTDDLVGNKNAKQVEIPDIITFIEHEDWLGLGVGPNPVKLYPGQRIVLKAFYRGSRGNADLHLTEEEIEWCKKYGLVDPDPDKGRGDIIGKYESGELFRELVLVWGRRSGKDFLVSLIALYEAMRLLEVPGGDPYQYYGLAAGAEISILTIAASQAQATIAFREIREKLRYSKYFSDKYKSEGLQAMSIRLQTKKDKIDNDFFKEKGLPEKLGSIVIEVGHSNPDTLVGKSCFMLILDEVASYRVGTTGSGSGDKIYALLQPTISTYNRQVPVVDIDGNPVIDPETNKPKTKTVYEGKIVSISSPRGKEGKLWELWETHSASKGRLACRVPTWVINEKHTQEALREEFAAMSNEEFMMEFGAEFSGTAGENMFSPDSVKAAFKDNLHTRDIGEPGKVYFAHLDPATNSHNYALVVCHKEIYLNPDTKKADFFIVVDHVKVWSPSPDQMIEVSKIDEYMITLKRRFHLGMVTYDMWNSASSVMKLRKHGIPAQLKSYNRKFKMEIYTELEELLKSNRLRIPRFGFNEESSAATGLLYNEMIHVQRKYDATGFKVYPKKEGDVTKTDDVVDALAGACYMALSRDVNRMPSSRLVNTGVSPQANNVVWRSMQGVPYGKKEWEAMNRIRGGGNRLGR